MTLGYRGFLKVPAARLLGGWRQAGLLARLRSNARSKPIRSQFHSMPWSRGFFVGMAGSWKTWSLGFRGHTTIVMKLPSRLATLQGTV